MTPQLTDGVVLLDRHSDADLDAHLAGEDEEQARRFGWYPARSTPETVHRAFDGWAAEWSSNGSTRTFALRVADSGELAGGCQLRLRGGSADLSYWVFPAFRRRGYATRALRLLTSWAFAEFGVARVELRVEPDNEASRGAAVAAGFVEEGLLPECEQIGDRLRDMVLYATGPTTS
ncbi:MAG: GNAT family N-acetyltransferase [Actinobacteria bacterium]|nr:GNAT family N-acetyltransferase [Actinomycetota bacterium]